MVKDVCRLCHEAFIKKDLETIQESKREVIKALGINLDLSLTDAPYICKNCNESLNEMFNFKAKCMYIDDYLTPFLEKDYCMDLTLIHPRAREGDLFTKTCQMCFSPTTDIVMLDERERELLGEFFSEIDSLHVSSLVCSPCQWALTKYFDFAMTCKKNEEENIDRYFESLENVKIENRGPKKKKIYKCDKCDYKTYQKSHLEMVHLKGHLDENSSYNCEKCVYSTNNKAKFDLHLTKGHKSASNKKYKCKKCDYSTNNRTYLEKIHILSHQSKFETYQCPHCPLKTKYRSSLTKHINTKHSNIVLYCFHCPFQTIHKISLIRHMKQHQISKKLYECDKCDFTAKTKYEIAIHMSERRNGHRFKRSVGNLRSKRPLAENVCKAPRNKRVYSCPYCNKKCNSSFTYKKHKIKEHGVGKPKYHQCPQCDYRTLYRKHILKHYKLHSDPDKNIYKCNQCSLMTYSSFHLKNHLVQDHQFDELNFDPNVYLHVKHFSIRAFKCSKCTYSCVREKTFRAHEKAHITFPFTCQQCPYRTDTAKKLDSHRMNHLPKRFKCPHCDHMTKTRSMLKVHMLKHKDRRSVETYKCMHCPFESIWKESLRTHMNIHLKEMYKCRFCNFQTVHKKSINSHEENVHKRPDHPDFKCNSCSFTTKCRSSIVQHQLVHKDPSEIKMFKCETCSFETKYKRSLRNHIRDIHLDESNNRKKQNDHSDSEEETFKCAKCPYETKKKDYLLRHFIVHRDGEIFKCDECSFETKRKSSLKMHQKTHKVYAEEDMVKCPHCDFMSKYPRSLKNHISNKHESWEVVEEEKHLKIVSLNG